MTIAENVRKLREEMAAAALASGRDPGEILLCAATKMNDAQRVREAIAAGVDCCGENRVQELLQKQAEDAYAGCPVHFIGHLQTNKAAKVVGAVSLIASVDRLGLLEQIDRLAAKKGIRQDILFEVNIGMEPQKSGFTEEETRQLAADMGKYPNVCLHGLMAIPPAAEKKGDNLRYFEKMRNLYVDIIEKKYDNISMDCLSMGMTDDFADAIACGSTMVRVGTAIFGARDYQK